MSESFAEIAPHYDALRPLKPADRARLQTMLSGLPGPAPALDALRLTPRDLVVEVGCGTGRLTLPMAALTPARVVGVDNEPRMLAVARAKSADPGLPSAAADAARRVEWIDGSAYHLPIADRQADLVLMAMVVHLLKQRPRAFREAHRILKPGGQLSLWTFTHESIRGFFLNPYFPSIPEIDLARFPDHRVLERELTRAGFTSVHTAIQREQGEVALAEVVDRVRGRYISTLTLLSPLEYRLGLQRLEEELAQDPTRTLTQRTEWGILTALRSAGSAQKRAHE